MIGRSGNLEGVAEDPMGLRKIRSLKKFLHFNFYIKLILLDLDCVLNSAEYSESVNRKSNDWDRFDSKTVAILKKLIEDFSFTFALNF